jgi:hypothetical protein
MKLILPVALTLCSVAALFAQSKPSFPVPRAEQEFEALFPHLEGLAGSIRGNQKAFTLAVLPYAPLDLQITKAKTHEEASALKNFYLGIAGAASGNDAAAMANSFHCGPSCIQYRKSDVVGKLVQISGLVDEFSSIPKLELLAQWGIKDEYRVNNVFHMMGQTNESLPSAVMGFIPSDRWRKIDNPETYLEEIKLSKNKFEALLTKSREMNLAAVARTLEGDIKVVRVGIGDNEAGLLFLKHSSKKPKTGQKMLDGKEYIYIEEVKPNIFYYETS